jgi:hypothetical protein
MTQWTFCALASGAGSKSERLLTFRTNTRARETEADFLAGQILEISDAGSNDYIQTEDGEVPHHAHIHSLGHPRVFCRKSRILSGHSRT